MAQRHGCGFIDCGFIDCANLNFEINEIDGLHYSKADHAKLAEVVGDRILELLDN